MYSSWELLGVSAKFFHEVIRLNTSFHVFSLFHSVKPALSGIAVPVLAQPAANATRVMHLEENGLAVVESKAQASNGDP
jgi:hypothetical protein